MAALAADRHLLLGRFQAESPSRVLGNRKARRRGHAVVMTDLLDI
jgi:hypothetical protein